MFRKLKAPWWVALALIASGCSDDAALPLDPPDASVDTDPDLVIDPPEVSDPPEGFGVALTRLFPQVAAPEGAFVDCVFASPLMHTDSEGRDTLIALGSDRVRGMDPLSGEQVWEVVLPAPDGRLPMAVATPVLVADPERGRTLLVVAYHSSTSPAGRNVSGRKYTQYAAVIDADLGVLAEDFATLEIQGVLPANEEGLSVPFRPDHALARSTLVHAGATGSHLGFVYVTYGNTRDIQPWHGFLFEVDLSAWREGGEPLRTRFTTTPEADCGEEGHSGSRERVCGGGLWAPSGPLLIPSGESYELILSPGNGQLDLARRDYANTLMRVRPQESGLPFFDPGCDEVLCVGFNPDDPDLACIDSCSDLWVPHLGEVSLPDSETCAGMTPFQCWEALDYIGGSTPVLIEMPDGPRVLAYPTKDGAIYLVDADHLGRQYDRRQLVPTCGTPSDPCRWDWAGMIVTQPALTQVDGEPLVLVPTFMPDKSQPAGVVALKIVLDEVGQPRFEPYWQYPRFDTRAAIERFRRHPSRIQLDTLDTPQGPVEVAWLVEAHAPGDLGRLLAISVATGELMVDEVLLGPGYRFMRPLVHEGTVYVTSCQRDEGPGYVEAYQYEITPDNPAE